MKFKKGDKIVITQAGGHTGIWSKEVGKKATVKKIDSDDATYLIEVCDNRNMWWVKEANIELAYDGCENCIHFPELCERCCHGYTDMYEPKPHDDGKREMQWILCSDRLPEEGRYYFVSTRYNETRVLPYWNGWNRTEGDDGSQEIKDYVIAWMPFPEHYEY